MTPRYREAIRDALEAQHRRAVMAYVERFGSHAQLERERITYPRRCVFCGITAADCVAYVAGGPARCCPDCTHPSR